MRWLTAALICAGLYVGTSHHWFMLGAVILSVVGLIAEWAHTEPVADSTYLDTLGAICEERR